ncbi:MAG: glycogen synthase [Acidobacteria bacterium]|nr:glycogen synthase [Acidobacteriota bacterium]
MRVLMVGSEVAPFAKSGGLGDVLGALPPVLVEAGIETAVVLPRYRRIPLAGLRKVFGDLQIWMSGGYYLADIYQLDLRGVAHYLVDCPPLYDRENFYGYDDDHVRFGALCRAALEVARHLFRPDVIHCHDWQAGLLPLYLKNFFPGDPFFAGIKSVMTIHSLEHRGLFGQSQLAAVGLNSSYWRSDLVEFNGMGSTMKAGIVFADRVTTVSPNYAREIQTPEFGFGLDGLLRARSGALTGLLNGVDYTEWNPETDPHIADIYSAEAPEGKRACKAALLKQFGFPVEEVIDRPLIGVVSRLADQKGFDLLGQVFHEFCAEDITFILLGSGDPRQETMFWHMEEFHKAKVRAYLGFSNALAHQIYAGSDMFLMPSKYEPCGLSQLYALRYGTIPIVRATGGLDDTIEAGTGFKFWGYNGWEMLLAIRSALEVYRNDPASWQAMVVRAMDQDFSWKQTVEAYRELYRSL